MQENTQYIAGLYCRLSKDDEQHGESVSIGTQRSILEDYCNSHGHAIFKFYIDDGYSGLNFNRPGFQEMLQDIDRGLINMVITKDLSRMGRDYIMTGYYTEIFFPSKDVRYLALADDFDSLNGGNEFAPFKNILNDMYARDISKKMKNAKHHQAKQGKFLGAEAPYGYMLDPDNKHRLIVDPEAAETVRLIFSLAEQGLGNKLIAAELKRREIPVPSAYKFQKGGTQFAGYPAVKSGLFYDWSYGTVGQILNNRVYTGDLFSLKTESKNYKTKHRTPVPVERQIITKQAHEAIIPQERYDAVQRIRAAHNCPAHASRNNIFRGKLFCECCGHPLSIANKKLRYREAEIYFCSYHCNHPDECPQTHRVYHEMLYPFVLQQIHTLAKSMKRRKINSKLSQYATVEKLTPEILDEVIERIEIGHVKHKSKPGNVIHIYWKLR